MLRSEIRPDARIVVTSGQVEDSVRRELAAWPMGGFLQKPCTVEALMHAIHALEEKRTQAAD